MTLKSVAELSSTSSNLLGEFDRGTGARGTIRDQLFATSTRNIDEVVQRSAQAGATAQGQFDVSEGIAARSERAITGGAGRDPRQQASSKRRLGLARALADVTARNLNVRGQRKEILGAQQSAEGLRGITDRQISGVQSTLAGEETTRNVDHQRALAAFAKKKAGGIGAIAGFAANFIPVVGPLVAPIVKSVVTSAAA